MPASVVLSMLSISGITPEFGKNYMMWNYQIPRLFHKVPDKLTRESITSPRMRKVWDIEAYFTLWRSQMDFQRASTTVPHGDDSFHMLQVVDCASVHGYFNVHAGFRSKAVIRYTGIQCT